MTHNIKKTDSLKIAIIIDIVIIILVCLLFSVESRGKYRLILLPILAIFIIILGFLSLCFLVKSVGKIIKWRGLGASENFYTWENLREKFTIWDIVLIIIGLLVIKFLYNWYLDIT